MEMEEMMRIIGSYLKEVGDLLDENKRLKKELEKVSSERDNQRQTIEDLRKQLDEVGLELCAKCYYREKQKRREGL